MLVVVAPDPVGLVVLAEASPYLELVYLVEARRGTTLGTRAVGVVIDEFFTTRAEEPWLCVTRPITGGGARLLRHLSFLELDSEMRLTRAAWSSKCASIAELF